MVKVEKEGDASNKRRCKRCGSTQVYIRIKDGSVVCRSCGNIDPDED